MKNEELKKEEEIQDSEMSFDEQLNQSDLDDLKGGISSKNISDAVDKEAAYGNSNCCNSSW